MIHIKNNDFLSFNVGSEECIEKNRNLEALTKGL